MTERYDIFPDIHGQADKLVISLLKLGYRSRRGVWQHSDTDRMALFLGDFVDRGPKNGEVIDIVRRMIDGGRAHAVMGNHELNAIHFHTKDPESGEFLRKHSDSNIRQHSAFLREFPEGSPKARDAIAWMTSLPLYKDLGALRIVHACWHSPTIAALDKVLKDGRLTEETVLRAGRKSDPLNDLVETTTKGPELKLPSGKTFTDPDGVVRDRIRVRWWAKDPKSWADLAASVDDASCLPTFPLPDDRADYRYPETEKPVFFGHYWMKGAPVQQAPNMLCLDYSAGLDGPLVVYKHDGKDRQIDISKNLTTGWRVAPMASSPSTAHPASRSHMSER